MGKRLKKKIELLMGVGERIRVWIVLTRSQRSDDRVQVARRRPRVAAAAADLNLVDDA
jgi:hypothetical protein